MSRRCKGCGGRFRPDGSWQRLCWPCWREAKDTDPRRRPRVETPVPAFSEPELLWACIRLCHPDVHPVERFELANKTTARLLALYEITQKGRAA